MTPEEHQMLKETRELAEQNAVLLRSIQRSNRLNTFFKALYWAVIIGLSFGAYYLIQPYVNTLKSSLDELGGASSSTGSALDNLRTLRNI